MILDSRSWMNIRRFRVLHEAGAEVVPVVVELEVAVPRLMPASR